MKVVSMRLYNRADQLRVFGLVGFELLLDEEATRAAKALELGVGPHKAVFPIEQLQDRRPGAMRANGVLVFHINTFRLENGSATVEVFAVGADGTRIGHRIGAYDILVDNRGEVAAATASALKSLDKPALIPAMVDSSCFGPHEDPALQPWFEREAGPLEKIADTVSGWLGGRSEPVAASSTKEALRDLKEFGYCILPERIPDSLCDELVRQAREFVHGEGRGQGYQWGSSQRLLNTHSLAAGKDVWLFPPVLEFLRHWFRDDPVACQTLFYFFGSEQQAHQDTIHLTPYPSGYMCGVWVALEDVEPGSGELFVYPKSHKLKRLRGRELGLEKVAADYSSFKVFDAAVASLMRDNGIKRTPYLAKKGSVLVWHENLVHGGEKRIHLESSRASIVSHYFAKGAVAYYDARGEAATLVEVRSRPVQTA